MSEVKLLGTGSCVPEKIVTNDDLAAMMDTSDEWIRTRTGICQRRIVTEETLTSLSVGAAQRALESAGILAESLDLIIVATLTPDEPLPNASCAVQKALGAWNACCFDLSAACSGFVFALHTAAMYIRGGAAKTALVIGAEVLSKIIDWSDRKTCILFGDGAGAAVLGASDIPGFLGAAMGTDGAKGHTLTMHERDIANPFRTRWLSEHPVLEPAQSLSRFVYMDGQEVFKFAVKRVPESIGQLLDQAGLTVADIDHFVLHQANYRIVEAVARRLKVSMDKFILNMDRYGNTSAASVAIALDELMRSGSVQNGDYLVLSGFGGGLTWGSLLFKMII